MLPSVAGSLLRERPSDLTFSPFHEHGWFSGNGSLDILGNSNRSFAKMPGGYFCPRVAPLG